MKRDCVCPRANHEHGTEQAYISDCCRCDDCRSAHAERMCWRRKQYAYGRTISKLTPAVGSARRIEALALNGWSCQRLADILGWDPVILHRSRMQPRIRADKAQAIADLFDQLWNRNPPFETLSDRVSASRTRAMAERRGYAPALAWDDMDDPDAKPYRPMVRDRSGGIDEIAVEEAVRGRHVKLTLAERNEAVRRLTERGHSAREIADRLRTTKRSVGRRRARAAA
jgi:hypothetical protein